MVLRELLSACVDCARRAAGEIHAVVEAAGGGRSLVEAVENKLEGKGGWDPLTEADIRAQRLILSLLSHRWPSLRIVGEEDGCEEAAASGGLARRLLEQSPLQESIVAEEEVPSVLRELPIDDICVFVDPLDGTKEFTKGNYAAVQTLIGIALRGRPIAGVMHAPFHTPPSPEQPDYKGATVYGIVGGGCHGLSQFPEVEERKRMVVTTSASRGSPKLLPILEALEPCDFLRCGGAGNKFMHMLRGAAQVYVFPDPYTSLWDTCAGEACLLARYPNAKVTDCHTGEELLYTPDNDTNNALGILATVEDHDKYLRIAQKAITKL